MSSEKLKHVAGPAGIAVDAMDVYWANLKAPLMGFAALMALGLAVNWFAERASSAAQDICKSLRKCLLHMCEGRPERHLAQGTCCRYLPVIAACSAALALCDVGSAHLSVSG